MGKAYIENKDFAQKHRKFQCILISNSKVSIMGLHNFFDRTQEALNARTTAYNKGLLSGDMMSYKVTCY